MVGGLASGAGGIPLCVLSIIKLLVEMIQLRICV